MATTSILPPLVEEAVLARCSPAQLRYWSLDRTRPGDPALNVAVRWRLRGLVDAGLAQESFQAILDRHEVLRTCVIVVDDEPTQLISPRVPFKLSEIDLARLPEHRREQEAERISSLEASTPFDVTEVPLIRATLLRVTRTEAIILVTAHHLVCDGWSMGVIVREFVSAYQSLSEARRPQFPALELHYADYAEWCLETLEEGGLGREADYWAGKLRGAPAVRVPGDRPVPPERTSDGRSLALLLPRGLTQRLQALAQDQGMTFFSVTYAVLILLLSERTGLTDIVVSTQIASRDEVELEPIVGPFVNTLVLRSTLDPEQTFGDLCATARDTFEDAIDHHAMPFDALVSALAPEGGSGARFPVSINFIVQRAFIGELHNESFDLAGIPSPLPGALYDLNFILVERKEGWRLTCEFHADLYEEATARDLLDRFKRIAETVAGAVDQRLSAVLRWPATPSRGLAETVAAASAEDTSDEPPKLELSHPYEVRATWLQQAGDEPAVIAVNHTAHNLFLYQPLARALGTTQPFLTMQVLDIVPASGKLPTIQEIARIYCDAILKECPASTYRLIGFCRSGVLVQEIANQLVDKGREVELLALVDCWAPCYFAGLSKASRDWFRFKRTVRTMRRAWQAGPRLFAMRMMIWLQSSSAMRRAMRLVVRRDADHRDDEAEFWRATDDLEAVVAQHRPRSYGGRAVTFRSESIPSGWPPDPHLGWSRYLERQTEMLPIPGVGHEGAFSAAGSRAMADAIKAMLPR